MRVARLEIESIASVPCEGIDKTMIRTVDGMASPAEQSIWNLSRERGIVLEKGKRYEVIINELV